MGLKLNQYINYLYGRDSLGENHHDHSCLLKPQPLRGAYKFMVKYLHNPQYIKRLNLN